MILETSREKRNLDTQSSALSNQCKSPLLCIKCNTHGSCFPNIPIVLDPSSEPVPALILLLLLVFPSLLLVLCKICSADPLLWDVLIGMMGHCVCVFRWLWVGSSIRPMTCCRLLVLACMPWPTRWASSGHSLPYVRYNHARHKQKSLPTMNSPEFLRKHQEAISI